MQSELARRRRQSTPVARARSKRASTAERNGVGTASSAGDGGGTTARTRRCAIYTRKSTEEGLDQAFNSLDAQREACAAYVLSQTHEGWTLLPDRYDDGGWSGGSLERPGLTQLLADVQAGKVDVIVVYKVDRLTRALAGFAKIVDVLDAAGASFVSVTQAFNTTTSMGRLTLNVLLSFAQFEREVIAERVRDKIAASKKKGMWMGGQVPLGYDVQSRKLVVNEAEADTVRHVYERYLALGSVSALLDELHAAGIVTKIQHQRAGIRGGVPFARGGLYHLLANRLYIGEVAYQGSIYPGEHEAIVERTLWDAVQAQLARNASNRSTTTNAKSPSLLAGLAYDAQGRRLSASHAVKSTRRYRYYITHGSQLDQPGDKQTRRPAHELEQIVVHRLLAWLNNPATVQATMPGGADAALLQAAFARVAKLVSALAGTPAQRRAAVAQLAERVDVGADQVRIAVRASAIGGSARQAEDADDDAPASLILTAPVELSHGQGARLIVGAERATPPAAHPNARLLALLAKAHDARALVIGRPHDSLTAIARDTGQCRKNLGELLRLSYLPPAIVTTLADGAIASATRATLLAAADGPLCWSAQQAPLQ